jgi:hypothetical protein
VGHALDWAGKLEAGERVRLFGSVWFYVWLIPLTIVGLLLLGSALRGVSDFATGRASPHISDPRSLSIPFSLLWAAVLLWLWELLLCSAIQFTPAGFYFWTWRGKRHFTEYRDVVGLEWNPPRADKVIVYLARTGNDQSSLGMRFDRARSGLVEATKSMIARRCELTESEMPEDPEAAGLLWRPGQREKFRTVPWWHP